MVCNIDSIRDSCLVSESDKEALPMSATGWGIVTPDCRGFRLVYNKRAGRYVPSSISLHRVDGRENCVILSFNPSLLSSRTPEASVRLEYAVEQAPYIAPESWQQHALQLYDEYSEWAEHGKWTAPSATFVNRLLLSKCRKAKETPFGVPPAVTQCVKTHTVNLRLLDVAKNSAMDSDEARAMTATFNVLGILSCVGAFVYLLKWGR